MGNVKQGKRKDTAPPFVWIDKSLFFSAARKELSSSAYVVYTCIRSKTIGQLNETACNENIKYAYSSLVKDTGLSIGTVRKCLIELENLGFIDLHEQGGLKSGGKSCNVYRLSMRFRDYGTDKFIAGILKIQHGLREHCGFAPMHKKKQIAPIKNRADSLLKIERTAAL
jgi:hypothetical protein